MCLNCANYENKLILNKPTRTQLKESEKKEISFTEGLKKFERSLVNPNPELEKQNTNLKALKKFGLQQANNTMKRHSQEIMNFVIKRYLRK